MDFRTGSVEELKVMRRVQQMKAMSIVEWRDVGEIMIWSHWSPRQTFHRLCGLSGMGMGDEELRGPWNADAEQQLG